MIRFSCPNCGRPYEVPDALAKLPLVCKQCGRRVVPAELAPAAPPPPAPVVPPVPPPPVPVAPASAIEKPVPKPAPPRPAPPAEGEPAADVLVAKAGSTPDIDLDVGGPSAARPRPAGLSGNGRPLPAEPDPAPDPDSEPAINLELLPKAAPAPAPKRTPVPPPQEPETPDEPKAEATVLPFVADAVVFVLLVVVGMFVGELLAKKPTGQVLAEAGTAAKFPPLDLLLWGGPPLMFALVYLLLNSREKTVGAWIRRRGASANRSPAP